MKKRTGMVATVIMALIAVVNISPSFAQGTYTGNLALGSQAEVNSFNYSEVTGSLTISGEDIVDLSPFSVLTTVGGYISISSNPALAVVDAFENLISLGGGIFVYYNANLVSFNGFDVLPSTGDNIDFWYNDSLITVSGFSALHTAGWSLEFGGNPALTDIPAFESLQTIQSSLFILDNVSLARITGFNALEYVDWSFNIIWNFSLKNLCGFYNYFSTNNPYTGGGSFDISDNHPDLPSPTTIGDILDAGYCAEQQIANLISRIESLELPGRTENNLIRPLKNALKFLEKDNVANATKQLEALIDKIQDQYQRGNIGASDAEDLVAAVLAIIDSINF